ncbi:MAG: hypothetical protein KF760_03780 [Candidatus Eremiobacteraeota bacterium]|nr:hypothetical protein [Candidatus Eremiobacteraeota bacterium]MCW5872662.1 hypothetical protein [Candidatus Eremiobacteraeota bacterium]
MNRWNNFLKQTDFQARFRLLVLILFPLWVCSLPLFHFALVPWLAGFLTPYVLTGLFQRYPRLPVVLVSGMLLSCYILCQVKLSSFQTTLLCCSTWFSLAFAAGTQWWTLSSGD